MQNTPTISDHSIDKEFTLSPISSILNQNGKQAKKHIRPKRRGALSSQVLNDIAKPFQQLQIFTDTSTVREETTCAYATLNESQHFNSSLSNMSQCHKIGTQTSFYEQLTPDFQSKSFKIINEFLDKMNVNQVNISVLLESNQKIDSQTVKKMLKERLKPSNLLQKRSMFDSEDDLKSSEVPGNSQKTPEPIKEQNKDLGLQNRFKMRNKTTKKSKNESLNRMQLMSQRLEELDNKTNKDQLQKSESVQIVTKNKLMRKITERLDEDLQDDDLSKQNTSDIYKSSKQDELSVSDYDSMTSLYKIEKTSLQLSPKYQGST